MELFSILIYSLMESTTLPYASKWRVAVHFCGGEATTVECIDSKSKNRGNAHSTRPRFLCGGGGETIVVE
jgi:hypothetical protein